ncbi:MAG: DMT family transporter [Bacteroidales bacterium]|nr:DMT family transporter [Bacteroidales bacterium]
MQAFHLRYNVYLLISAIIWGFAFVAQKDAMSFFEPFYFNFLRFLLGFMVLLFIFHKRIHSLFDKKLIRAGVWLGFFLFLGSTFQQIGIISTQASNAGFITSMYIVFIPIVGYFFKQRATISVWFAIIIALTGFAFLSINIDNMRIGVGDLLVFIGSICWAIHVNLIEFFSTIKKSIEIAMIQFFICGMLSLLTSIVFEQQVFTLDFRSWIPILYAGLFSVGIAFTLQVYAQRFVPSSVAGIILSSESLFALLGGMIVFNETLNKHQWLGVLLILMAIVWVQVFQYIKSKNYAFR